MVRSAIAGARLMVTTAEESRFIGIVGFVDRGKGVLEMIYGIAPRWRGRGLASRAVRLAARWAAALPGVKATELRIDQDMIECQHVAVNAGFVVAGTVRQFVPGTGATFEDLRYVLERRGAGREDTEPQRLRLTRSSLAVQRNNQFRCTGPAEIALRISGATH